MNKSEKIDAALRGELSEKEYAEIGMALFHAGYASLDPLASGARRFPLTEKGIRRAKMLRAA